VRPIAGEHRRAGGRTHHDGVPSISWRDVPALTRDGIAEVDRLAVEEFGIGLPQMMEQAGSHLAEVVRLELGGDLLGRRVVVAVGPGNNGGGGLVAARHLANRGAAIRVVLARPALRLAEAARDELATLLQMGIACCVGAYDLPEAQLREVLAGADLIVDAVLGYNASGPPHGEVEQLIARLDEANAPIVSLDLPSGLDADTGTAAGGVVSAHATMTLALPKVGLFGAPGRALVGRLYLADIGLPAALYRRLGLDVDAPFRTARIVRLDLES
jgi:NAD(P)H-hydrate epimerase